MRSLAFGTLLVWAYLPCITSSALAETLTMKCSFEGIIPQEIVYVINSSARDVAVIGEFGTHQAVLLNSPFQIRSATGQHRRHGGVSGGGKGRGQGL